MSSGLHHDLHDTTTLVFTDSFRVVIEKSSVQKLVEHYGIITIE
ncbi:MAG: hypothetical protein ACQ9ET_05440 [Nitrosomonadaceae bacterium]